MHDDFVKSQYTPIQPLENILKIGRTFIKTSVCVLWACMCVSKKKEKEVRTSTYGELFLRTDIHECTIEALFSSQNKKFHAVRLNVKTHI